MAQNPKYITANSDQVKNNEVKLVEKEVVANKSTSKQEDKG